MTFKVEKKVPYIIHTIDKNGVEREYEVKLCQTPMGYLVDLANFNDTLQSREYKTSITKRTDLQ